MPSERRHIGQKPGRKGRNMKQEENKTYSIFSNVLYFHRYLYREKPRMALHHVMIVLGRILGPFLAILMPGIVVSVVQKGELLQGLGVIALAGLLYMVCDGMAQGFERGNYFNENVFRTSLLGDAVMKEMKLHYKEVEYGERKNIIKRAYQCMDGGDWAVSYRMLDFPRDMVVNVACFLLYSTVLSTLKPWMVVFLLLLSLLNYGVLQLKNRWMLALRDQFAQSEREIKYLTYTLRDTDLAKDMRIFSMNDWMMAFRNKVFGERMKLEKKNNRKMILADFLQILLTVLRNGLAYGYLIHSCLTGEIALGSFLVYFGAITGFSGFVTGMVDTYTNLKLANEEASCFRAHMDMPETDDAGEVPEALYRQPAEIEFRDVTFSYGKEKIYDHFNLVIHPGEKIALLGVNGVGKTTLIKLLCGLYEPDGGTILINGVDISRVQKRGLYDLFSVVFQEASIFPYPVGSNISMKKLEDTDEEKAWEALRQAGLEEEFREKGIGMNSFMTSQAFEGVELSGGQRQRFLLARALYKGGNILILDEPTSALDPVAESQIYEEYVKLSRGRTSIFISHRLASTKFSDRILFLEDGRVTEEGTHEELMKKGGSYAHMFEIQSHYYQTDQRLDT